MKVIKHIISTGTKTKVDYPAIWGEPVIGLDPDINFYEIQEQPKPPYNPEQFTISEVWTLTENVGEFLSVCEIGWQLTEKSQTEVINNLNRTFGEFIDNAYPLWQRIKDLNYPSDEGTMRKAQEAALRDERQAREDAYINENIFPDFKFTWL